MSNQPKEVNPYTEWYLAREFREQELLAEIAELRKDRDEWKDATIFANQRFKIAEEEVAKMAHIKDCIKAFEDESKQYAAKSKEAGDSYAAALWTGIGGAFTLLMQQTDKEVKG